MGERKREIEQGTKRDRERERGTVREWEREREHNYHANFICCYVVQDSKFVAHAPMSRRIPQLQVKYQVCIKALSEQ